MALLIYYQWFIKPLCKEHHFYSEIICNGNFEKINSSVWDGFWELAMHKTWPTVLIVMQNIGSWITAREFYSNNEQLFTSEKSHLGWE